MAKIYYSRISVTGLGTLTLRVIDAVQGSKLEEGIQSEEFKKLQDVSGSFQHGVLKKYSSEHTKQVVAQDEKRDSILTGFRMNIQANLHSPLPEIKEAAEKASEILERFGSKIEFLPYSEETMYILKILEEFKKPEAAEIVKTLNLGIWIDALDTSQKEFEKVFASKTNDMAAIGEIESASRQRKALQTSFSAFLDFVSAMQIVKKTQEWKDLANLLQKEIDAVVSADRKPHKPEEVKTDETIKK